MIDVPDLASQRAIVAASHENLRELYRLHAFASHKRSEVAKVESAPPCEECDGTGVEPEDLRTEAECIEGPVPCHRCGGSGIEPQEDA